jgi:CelD/BcsL family acetyltransferase involved in cellulose biosynthesis
VGHGVKIRQNATDARAKPGSPETQLSLLALDDPRWAEFVASCAAATPFHHPAWATLVADAYGFRPFVLAIVAADGRPLAGAPFIEVRTLARRRRWISLPFTDRCSPLALDASSEHRLFDLLSRAPERLDVPPTEIRSSVAASAWAASASAALHVLELDRDVERLRQRFSRSQVIRNIKRAEREGVTVRPATSHEDLDAFYALHLRTRRRQGVPIQPYRFFELLWTRMIQAGLGSILLASSGGAPLAGALFLSWNQTTIYKFGASDPEGWPRRPNHALFWTAIQAAVARGDRFFDFGRTDLDNSGLRAFKSSWGAEERPLVYSSCAGKRAGAGLPDRLLATAIRRGPPWLCRRIGESFYRYAATR